jgi:ABC-type phosphate transport system permease subunit
MDTPIPMRIFGYVVVVFGLCVLGAAIFLFTIFPEHTLRLVLVVALEVIAGLASIGWGAHLVRSDTA